MANHTNPVFLVAVNDLWVKGDPFYPEVSDKITDAFRNTTMADAKKYLKTASKRIKEVKGDLRIVKAIETRDDKFNLIKVEVEGV